MSSGRAGIPATPAAEKAGLAVPWRTPTAGACTEQLKLGRWPCSPAPVRACGRGCKGREEGALEDAEVLVRLVWPVDDREDHALEDTLVPPGQKLTEEQRDLPGRVVECPTAEGAEDQHLDTLAGRGVQDGADLPPGALSVPRVHRLPAPVQRWVVVGRDGDHGDHPRGRQERVPLRLGAAEHAHVAREDPAKVGERVADMESMELPRVG